MSKQTMNVGEWSEAYTLLKIFDEQKLFNGLEDLEINPNLYVEIIHAIKESKIHNKPVFYLLNKEDGSVSICFDELGKDLIHIIPKSLVTDQTLSLYSQISSRGNKVSKGAFPVSSEFISFIENEMADPILKGKNSITEDLLLRLRDEKAPQKIRDGGFSIKSLIGGNPNIFNSTQQSNITYSVKGFDTLTKDDIDYINNLRLPANKNGKAKTDVSGRVRHLYSKGCKLVFDSMPKILQANLETIDSRMPELYAEATLLHFISDKKPMLSELVQTIEAANPFNLSNNTIPSLYEKNFKSLLIECLKGMIPGRIWDKSGSFTGGFIIVKSNGDLVCYHIFNMNKFANYVFKRAKLDTAQASRHKFGTLTEDGKFKLNISIRFK